MQGLTTNLLVRYEGNSDPFNSQAVKVDAQAGYYLNVGCTCIDIVPFETGLWAHSPPRGRVAPSGTESGRRSLLDFPSYYSVVDGEAQVISTSRPSAFAYAILANYAGWLFTLTEDVKHLGNAIEYAAKCMRGLGNYLAEGQAHDEVSLEHLVFRLLRAELATQNFTTALTHAISLKNLVEQRVKLGLLDLSSVYHAVYTTNQLAFAFWTRSLYRPSWVRSTFERDWAPFDEFYPSLGSVKFQLFQVTAHEELCELLTSTKGLFVQTSIYLREERYRSIDKWYGLQSRGEWLQMCLFNIVLAEEDRATLALVRRKTERNENCTINGPPQSNEDLVTTNMTICLALTGILSIRYQSQDPVLDDNPLSPLMMIILSKLSACFTTLDEGKPTSTYSPYHDALLWICLVAAIVEHRHRKRLAKQDLSGVWFDRLVSFIQAMKTSSVGELKRRLSLFPFSEDETPIPNHNWLARAFKGPR